MRACIFMQVLLSNPVLKNAVNLEAAQMLKNNYPQYREKVVQCVTNSKQLEGNKYLCFLLLIIDKFFLHYGEF